MNHADLNEYKAVEFFDDGYSGTNFERPAVIKLLDEVKAGNINGIIVKDFSRFGRSYLEVGDYLEQVFPFLGVRFISINDGFDSKHDNGITAGMNIGLKNFIYDMYSKDLSVKVKTAKLSKMKKGEFISAFAPYGYKKSKEKKNTIVVDEVASTIVKRIFELAVNGNNPTSICKILNAEGVPSPSMHHNSRQGDKKYLRHGKPSKWNASAVLRILKDETFLGKTISHKREIIEVGSNKSVAIAPSDWIVVENTHEPLVSVEVFKQAQCVIRKTTSTKYKKPKPQLLSGKLRCGTCKNALMRSRTKATYFTCHNAYYSEDTSCVSERIYEQEIIDVLLKAIKTQAQLANVAQKMIDSTEKRTEKETVKILKNIQGLELALTKANNLAMESYDLYLDNQMSKEKYFEMKNRVSSENQALSNEILMLKADYEIQLLKSNENKSQFVENFQDCQNVKTLTRELVETLVEAVYILSSTEIEIVWKFSDDFSQMINPTEL